MSGEDHPSADQTRELDEVIAAYLEAVEQGVSPSRDTWLARYPQFATRLAEFFADQDWVGKWAQDPGLATTESFIPRTTEDHPASPDRLSDAKASRPRRPSREPIGPGTVLAPGAFQDHRYSVFAVKSGGMGRVYLADSLDAPPRRLHDKAAIKTVIDFDEWCEVRRAKGVPADESRYAELLVRFRREALAWVRLGPHENIIFAWWVFEMGDKPYLLMDYADSGDLGSWIRQRRLNVPLALNFAVQFCEGMKYAVRTAGIVHRDIKPSNVLIQADRIVKIADFGLAKAFYPDTEQAPARRGSPDPAETADRQVSSEVGRPSAAQVARSGDRPQRSGDRPQHQGGDPIAGRDARLSVAGGGTPIYMPPEQWVSLSRADTRSDIFSFGAMLFEMLTYRRLFAERNAYDMALAAARLPLVHEINPQVPVELSQVVTRCLAYDPAQRLPSFEALATELSRIQEMLPGRLPVPRDPNAILSALFTPSIQALGETYSLISLGRYEEAAHCAQRGIDVDSENYEHWVNKGKALVELGNWREARHCFLRATQVCPSDARSWANLGWAELELGDLAAALSAAERSVHLDGRFGDGWMCLGCCQWDLGRQHAAIDSLRIAVDLEPHHWKTHFNLGKCLAQLARPAEALPCLRRAVEIDPQNPSCWGLLVSVYGLAAAWDEASATVAHALQLHPDDATLWALRAWVLWSRGEDRSTAGACLKRAFQLDADNEQAHVIRAAMEQVGNGESV